MLSQEFRALLAAQAADIGDDIIAALRRLGSEAAATAIVTLDALREGRDRPQAQLRFRGVQPDGLPSDTTFQIPAQIAPRRNL